MPKPETDVPFHVTLRSPVGIKLGGEIAVVRSFDATIEEESSAPATHYSFKVDRIWPIPAGASGFRQNNKSALFRGTIIVPRDNVAGIVPQPFMERQ